MAMNEKLVAPLPFTIAHNGGVTLPDNLANDRMGRACSWPATDAYFVIDLGAVKEVDTVALLATNGLGADWYIRGTATSALDAINGVNTVFAVLQAGATPLWQSTLAQKRVHRQGIAFLPATYNVRYIFVQVTGTGAGFKAGRLVVGKSFTAEDTMDVGYSYKVIDLGEQRVSRTGLDDPTIRGKVLEYRWVWSWMSEQEARGPLLDLLAYAGQTRDILAILNPDAADLHNVIAYGKLTEEVEGLNVAGGDVPNAYEAAFTLRSKLILNL